ncbi:probable F-box protein At4g22030 [Humulus lupulus]|uniref:probable F-box protein At4g22030 n=1 Tax=Humulus lupulus TaxID=3486 RepID=UPI002B40EA3D|nr:probable F-box protein At4g22030 [Humulus lupulus]
MSALQASSFFIFSSSSSSSSSRGTINAAIHVPKLPNVRFTVPKQSSLNLTRQLVIEELNNLKQGFKTQNDESNDRHENATTSTSTITAQLYSILEAVNDRVEMHDNIGKQRDNWNTLLLNSINMITLTATTIAGVAAAAAPGSTLLALNVSSTLLFSAAAGMLLVMNKLQPSQLAEEQRNASRLFRQIKSQIETDLALRSPTEYDIKKYMDKVLSLDRAYPLPLLGAMLEKFPQKYEPATWWPSKRSQKGQNELFQAGKKSNNGWNETLEEEMREVIQVAKTKDREDYERLGNLVLKINKALALSGPLLTGIAAVSSPFVGHGSWGGVLAVTAGALASAVNAFQHGGQVGMVFEMYRNCGGAFKLMEDEIKATIAEEDFEKRENGELFQMKLALQLGRSLSQLKELSANSASSRVNGTTVDEFASKLF